MSQILLSISIMCSKNLSNVKRAIESVLPILEAIPSELLLTNTVGEELREVLQQYPARVLDYVWDWDFAKARNLGLREARGSWFFYMDDDEWMEDSTPLIQFFASGEYLRYQTANYRIRNYQDEEGTRYVEQWVNRMICRGSDTIFKGKIHEYLYPIVGDCKGLNLIVHHDGYVFRDEEKKLAHYNRNMTILKTMIAEEPDNVRWRLQALQEHQSVGRHDRIVEETTELLALYQEESDVTYQQMDSIYAIRAEAFERLSNPKAVMEVARMGLADARIHLLCKTRLHLLLAQAKLEMGESVYEDAEKYLELREQLPTMGIEYENMKLALFLEDTFDDLHDKKLSAILVVQAVRNRDTKAFRRWFENLHWEQEYVYSQPLLPVSILDMLKLFETDADVQLAGVTIYRNDTLWTYFRGICKIEEYPIFYWLMWKENPTGTSYELAQEFCGMYQMLLNIEEEIQHLRENGAGEQADVILNQVRKIAPWKKI